MVLAAGLGLRMRPLTDSRPKALVEVGGKALIDHVLDRLARSASTRAVVNVHAFADQMEAHLAARAARASSSPTSAAALLDTGGGIKHARALLGEEPIWVPTATTSGSTRACRDLALVPRPGIRRAMDACLWPSPRPAPWVSTPLAISSATPRAG